ncbi:MAG TPA: hypothetical protein VFM82_05795 [Flavobacteriaceae bacterium]|nr:hypothetical protein [Flavobacteriaceae bacterium]
MNTEKQWLESRNRKLNNLKKYLWIATIAGVVLLFLFLRQCSETRNLEQSRENVENYLADTISHYTNERGQMVAEKRALKGEKENLLILLNETSDQLRELTEKFDKVSAAGEIEQQIIIDTIKVPYEVPVPFEFSRNWSKNDKFYYISGTSNQFGNIIDSISIPNKISFAIGDKSIGFWKDEFRIEVVNSNKYINTIGLDAYSFERSKKRFGISVYAGYGIGENFTFTPQIGIGFSFDLIRF